MADDGSDHKDRHGDREDLEPILEGLDERDAFHATERDVERDDGTDHDDPDGVVQAREDVGERRASALHLRHRVEEANEEHEADRNLAEDGRVVAAFGEVRDGVGAEPTQWTRDEEQQEEVAARVANRIPQRIVAIEHHHASDAHERRGGEVFARDGRGVPADGHRAARDEEVAGALGLTSGPEAHTDGNHNRDQREEGDPRVDSLGGGFSRGEKGEEGVHVISSGRPGLLWLRRPRGRWSAG